MNLFLRSHLVLWVYAIATIPVTILALLLPSHKWHKHGTQGLDICWNGHHLVSSFFIGSKVSTILCLHHYSCLSAFSTAIIQTNEGYLCVISWGWDAQQKSTDQINLTCQILNLWEILLNCVQESQIILNFFCLNVLKQTHFKCCKRRNSSERFLPIKTKTNK